MPAIISLSGTGSCGGNNFRYPVLKEDGLSAERAGGHQSKRGDMLWRIKSPQSLLTSGGIAATLHLANPKVQKRPCPCGCSFV
jgi:hypothetical protein